MVDKVDSTLRDCKLSFLRHEYARYSQLIANQTHHVEKLYKENIISINARNNYIKSLTELISFMNTDVYNYKIRQIKSTEQEVDSDLGDAYSDNEESTQSKKSSNDNINIGVMDKNIVDLFSYRNSLVEWNKITTFFDIYKNSKNVKLNKINIVNEIMFDDYDKVKIKLLEICKEVGFYSLDDALNILINRSYRDIPSTEKPTEADIEFKDRFEVYNASFTPIDYRIVPRNTDAKEFFIKSVMEWQLNKQIPNTDIHMDTYGEVSIQLPNIDHCYIFGGYFISDPILCIIRTSQVCRKCVYEKKKQFQTLIDNNEIDNINKSFANIYIKNMHIGEILSYNNESFIKKITSDYARYSLITRMKSFKSQLDEFQKDNNLKNMYTMIKLLLLGPDECINVAGVLFGLIKNKKYNAEMISELIYRKLTYTLQTRLKKSSVNLTAELDKLKNMSESDVDIKRQITISTTIPQHIKKIIFEKLEESKFQAGETTKNKLVTDILIKYPWVDTNTTFETLRYDDHKCRKTIDNVYNVLKNKVYGHTECKNTIQELVCKMIMNPSSGGKAIGLVGPPGVGKTLIAKALGEALNIPSIVISLCGVEDPAVLNGHSFTYSAAQPGIIIKKMVEAGSARCVMFFDELDKSCQKHGVNEVQNVLINITDPNMNTSFNDKFFDVGFPLNKVIFVFSYNDKSKIDPILLNRIHEINVDAYSVKDKVNICQEFLLKEILEGIGLEHKSILIDDADLEYVCENYTREPGVRELKRKLEALFLKLNVDRIYRRGPFRCDCRPKELCENCNKCDKCKDGKHQECTKCKECKICNVECKPECKMVINAANPVKIDRDIIIKYLHKPKHEVVKVHENDEVGVINGLYATTIGGGGIIKILVYKNFGSDKFVLKITGSQGRVMKESITYAFTVAANLVKDEYMKEFIKNNKAGLHIHALDGATKKDGPSAGGCHVVAFISRILNKKIRRDIAMTGEVGKSGDINTIGGLPYKIRGGREAGVKTIFAPKGNEKDYDELKKSDPKLFEDLEIKIVSHVKEVLALSLIEDDGTPFDVDKYLN